MEILIGKGAGEIRFGMSEQDVMSLWGLPDKKYTDEFGDIYAQYFPQQYVLKFEKDNDNRLGWIEVYNTEVRLLGELPWRKRQNEIVQTVASMLDEQPEMEDYGSFESVAFKKSWLELQFELGRLRCVNFGVLFDANDEPVWPIT